MSIRVQNPWFFFPVKVEDSNFSKIRIFWWEISTAYRNFRLSEKISFKNFKFDVNVCAVQKASNLVGWSYKTRFSLLNVQTFVERKNNWNRTRIGDLQKKKNFACKNSTFFYIRKKGLIQEKKNSSYWSVVALTKTERSSKLVVGNIDRPMHKLQCNPQNKFQLFHVWAFLVY